MSGEIVMYGKENCSDCTAAKLALEEIPFSYKDVATDLEANNQRCDISDSIDAPHALPLIVVPGIAGEAGVTVFIEPKGVALQALALCAQQFKTSREQKGE